MKYFILIAMLSVLLFAMFPSNKSVKFNLGTPEAYIENVQNLSSSGELKQFFEAQSAIYIDNVYSNVQRFCYKLLGELPPKCKRGDDVKWIVWQMERFLEVEDVAKKFAIFEQFAAKLLPKYDAIFEYDAEETRLSAKEFNDLYIASGVDQVLSFANDAQLEAFVEHTANGIRAFLIHNRARLEQSGMLKFKSAVDEFLERPTFVEKLVSLKAFLSTSRDILE